MTILITGARAPIALEMSRSFAKHGHRVIMADSQYLTIARWSNTVARYYILPSARYKTGEYVAKINDIIEKENVTHLIPTCEEAFYIAVHKDELKCKVWTAEKNLMHNLHNKLIFPQFAQPFLPIPETQLVTNFSDWQNSSNYVFKPIYSRFATATIIGKQLSESYFNEIEKTAWIAQKRILGKEICVYSIWNEGVLKGYAAYHPLYRVGKGSGIFFEPVIHLKTQQLIHQFGQTINYTGQLCFDVIIDDLDTPNFIECNPRGTSGAHLINNKIALCYLENADLIVPNNDNYSIKYAMALLHPLAFFTKKARDSHDVIYKKDDKKPFFLQFLSIFEITYIKIFKRLSWLAATTGDIEWNGELSDK
jgi:hypothetical protein